MTDSRRVIVVTGPTGQQGGATARALVQYHSEAFRVRCICRNPGNDLARALIADLEALEKKHVRKELQGRTWEVVKGDLMDKSSLLKHFEGAYGVFLVTTWATQSWKVMKDTMEPPTLDGVAVERQQGINAIDAAIEREVPAFVYTSVGGLKDDYVAIAYWNSKLDVERYLKSKAPRAGMKWAILSPCMFYDNFNTSQLVKGTDTEIKNGYPGRTRMRFVAVSDIGWFGAYLFANIDQWTGKKLELATDILSYDEVAERFANYTGKPFKHRRLAPAEIPKAADPPPAEGSSKNLIFTVDIDEIRKMHPQYVTLDQWLATTWVGRDAAPGAKI
ncbi:hypothetical protein DFJ74DRAFT_765760 [Hyaloraphidium curvatum]|nr:hypothetical protein DFJ74DRAFT_765760 [Hyaloraphidium curvatum]